MFFGFIPWSKRNSPPKPRLREELTEDSRVRLANILKDINGEHIQKGYKELQDYTGHNIVGIYSGTIRDAEESQFLFLKNDSYDINIVLDYLEYVLNVAFTETPFLSKDKKIEIIYKIERTFEEEGILVQIKPSSKEIFENNGYHPPEDGFIQFQQVSDETIIDTDQEVRVFAMGERWSEPLAPYNKAWEMYKDGTHTTALIEKLYNSLELTTEKICSDLNNWEEEGKGVGRYIEVLKEQGLFEDSPQMSEEAAHIVQSLRVTIHRMGGDRKRHIDIDSDYCIFVLHQTSAYLSYFIKRYEKNFE
ncbi:hypothetical protein [Haloferax sp. YSSS75]|uniref:hypothetical protein n=1 Tax=Haloferax sp. YSSS75 TaxID=3388564 RepID=UPI00398D1127